jgi:hypothetical protein
MLMTQPFLVPSPHPKLGFIRGGGTLLYSSAAILTFGRYKSAIHRHA